MVSFLGRPPGAQPSFSACVGSAALDRTLAGLLIFSTRPQVRRWRRFDLVSPPGSALLNFPMGGTFSLKCWVAHLALFGFSTSFRLIFRRTLDHQLVGFVPRPSPARLVVSCVPYSSTCTWYSTYLTPRRVLICVPHYASNLWGVHNPHRGMLNCRCLCNAKVLIELNMSNQHAHPLVAIGTGSGKQRRA